jgi:Do/DeqQ family serine protease
MRRLLAGFLFAALTLGFVLGVLVDARFRAQAESRAEAVTPAVEPAAPQTPRGALGAAAAAGLDFTGIAGRAVKGVANISSLQVVHTRSPFGDDPFFRYFFGDDAVGGRDRRSLSLGSGVIISSDGYIVTNNHVVGENMREISVTLPDKREAKGRLVGTDPATDIALVKVSATGLLAVSWGDSNLLKVGEWVLAIGSPYQLSQTVTAGIVSATGRTGLGFADYEDFIQTDAAINRGNSGGALINARGELVGINTGIVSESGGYQGIGFAVPSNLARRIVDELRDHGEIRRGSVDFRFEALTADLAQEVGVSSTRGAVVTRMYRNSASYEAGLQPGDVILAFNGQPIDDPAHLSKLISDAKIGSTAALRISRAGRTVDLKIPILSSASARRR